MIRLLLAAALLLSGFAFARAQQEDAYGSLVGMADSAASDKGPDAGEIPSDLAPAGKAPAAAAAPVEAPRADEAAPRPAQPKPAAPARAEGAAPARAAKNDDSAAVSAPAAPAPRVWTKLFASLLPPVARVGTFEVAASTVAWRPRPAAARPVTPASEAGSAQGLIEFVAAATAPASPAVR